MNWRRMRNGDYADESRYQDFNTEDHRNYDFHIRALDAEAALGCLDIISAASGNHHVCVQLHLGNKEVHDV